jgi:hypothetical protein
MSTTYHHPGSCHTAVISWTPLILTVITTVRQVFYPKISPTREHYDRCRNEHGGYGGLLSVLFREDTEAIKFFDALQTYKGPSLGTNFTLRYVAKHKLTYVTMDPTKRKSTDYRWMNSSPYVILAHFTELPWVSLRPSLIAMEHAEIQFRQHLTVLNRISCASALDLKKPQS